MGVGPHPLITLESGMESTRPPPALPSGWTPGVQRETTVREEVRAPLSAALVLLACTPNAPTLFRLRTPSEALGVSLAVAQKAWISVLLRVSPPAKLEHSP